MPPPPTIPVPKYDSPVTSDRNVRDENPRHKRLAEFCRRLITMSETFMANRWPQWQMTDRRMRAFVDVTEVDQITNRFLRPHDVKLVLPTSYAILHSIVTYRYTVFTSKNVLIPLEAMKQEEMRAAQLAEEVLDGDMNSSFHNARLMLWAWLFDAAKYGIGIEQDEWYDEHRRVTVRDSVPVELFGIPMGAMKKERREWKRVYSGNRTFNIDPYMYTPDPRVPLGRVQEGDYTGYAWWRSWTELKRQERNGKYQNIDEVEKWSRERIGAVYDYSARLQVLGLPSVFDATGAATGVYEEDKGFVFGHTLWVKIIPSEFDLGGDDPEIWVVALANYDTIIRCERWDYDHGEFPISVLEPNYDGYSSANLGDTEILQPLQDLGDWLAGSHFDNVKKAINNMLIFKPQDINLDDLMHPGPAKWVRTSQHYAGNARDAMHQFPVEDITRGHIADLALIKEEMVRTSGTPEPMLGMQPRTKQQATVFAGMVQMASARQKVVCQILSMLGVRPWGRRCLQNIQQFMDEETFVKITGNKAKQMGLDPYATHILNVAPEEVQGAFDFPVHTGDIPPDPNRAVELWKEILFGVAKIPSLAQRFDLVEIFKQLVYSAGIKNFDAFLVRTQVMPDEHVMGQVQAGNMVPAGEVTGNGGGQQRPGREPAPRSGGGPPGGPGGAGQQSGLAALLLGTPGQANVPGQ